MRLIVGMIGATGTPLGVSLLQTLRGMPEVETHLVLSKWTKITIELETPHDIRDASALADYRHNPADQVATISSRSFHTNGMIIIPCSMKTLAGIRADYVEGLASRAADAVLKEGRKLAPVPCEMPLSAIHLENTLVLSRMGAVMILSILTYYNHPQTVDNITQHIVTRVLDQSGLEHLNAHCWQGLRQTQNFSQEDEQWHLVICATFYKRWMIRGDC